MVEPKQKTICPQCKAPFNIPETGLNMTCEFCGFQTQVPDANERREELEELREEEREQEEVDREQREQAAERAKEEQARRQQQQRDRQKGARAA